MFIASTPVVFKLGVPLNIYKVPWKFAIFLFEFIVQHQISNKPKFEKSRQGMGLCGPLVKNYLDTLYPLHKIRDRKMLNLLVYVCYFQLIEL